MWLIYVGIVLIIWIYISLSKTYKYWIIKGVPQLTPLLFFGNIGPLIFKTCSLTEFIHELYNKFPEQRYFGIYQFFKPALFIRCPNLIKTITIKEFDTFPEHRLSLPEDADPLFTKNIFSMRGGQRWHDLRSVLSPSFTSSKLKQMFGLMEQCASQLVKHYDKQPGPAIVEMKDVFSRYTNDVIGTTAFGVTCNSFENPENEFYLMGKDATDINSFKLFKLFINSISPFLFKIINVSIISARVNEYFRSIITQTLRLREKHNIVRPDMIHLLMEAQKAKPDIVLTDEDIACNAFLFFLGGFDTSSTAMTFTSYELAINPEIQKNLQGEVDEVLEAGELTYEALLDMKYMDMVISEALRKWPPIMFTERRSVKDIILENGNPGEKPLYLEIHSEVWIPIYGLHHDPKYFPEPDRFDPERFNETNRHGIDPFTYLPFGLGPKNCIGMRFALLEVKLIIFYILKTFNIVTTSKTPIPLIWDKSRVFPLAKDGVWLELQPRSDR